LSFSLNYKKPKSDNFSFGLNAKKIEDSTNVQSKTARNVAKAIVDDCILIYGAANEILTDMGTEFKNQTLKEICSLLKINLKTSTPYHHQTLGMVERSHRVFNEYMRAYLLPNRLDWDEWLKYFAYCYNTTPSSVHGFAPFELIFGKTPKPFEFMKSEITDPVYNLESFEKDIKFKLQEAHKRAHQLSEKAKLRSKEQYDKTANPIIISIGDNVLVKNEAGHKLENLYKGPYQVTGIDNLGNCEINTGQKTIIIHKNRLKLVNK